MPESKPSEITILVALQAIGAAGWILIGSMAVLSGGFAGIIFAQIGAIIVGAGIMLILMGAIDLALTYGLWKGRALARMACMALAAISIALTIPSIMTGVGLVRLLIDALILFILMKPRVRAFYTNAPMVGSEPASH
jgi:hypothetical protein